MNPGKENICSTSNPLNEDNSKQENLAPVDHTEYIVNNIRKVFLSNEVFTPNNPPRRTQTTFGKQLSRADGSDFFDPRDTDIKVPDVILDKCVTKHRESWVPRPEETLLVTELDGKYSLKYNFNPALVPKLQLFLRPYYLELECLKEFRRRGLEKCEVVTPYRCTKVNEVEEKDEGGVTGYFKSPFWWKKEKEKHETYVCLPHQDVEETGRHDVRWQPKVYLGGDPKRNWCERKKLMNSVGLPFKHEANNFYFENHPPPTVELTKIKFST